MFNGKGPFGDPTDNNSEKLDSRYEFIAMELRALSNLEWDIVKQLPRRSNNPWEKNPVEAECFKLIMGIFHETLERLKGLSLLPKFIRLGDKVDSQITPINQVVNGQHIQANEIRLGKGQSYFLPDTEERYILRPWGSINDGLPDHLKIVEKGISSEIVPENPDFIGLDEIRQRKLSGQYGNDLSIGSTIVREYAEDKPLSIPEILKILNEIVSYLNDNGSPDQSSEVETAIAKIEEVINGYDKKIVEQKEEFGDKKKEHINRLIDFIKSRGLPLPRVIGVIELGYKDSATGEYFGCLFLTEKKQFVYATKREKEDFSGGKKEVIEYSDFPKEKESLAYYHFSYDDLISEIPIFLRLKIERAAGE